MGLRKALIRTKQIDIDLIKMAKQIVTKQTNDNDDKTDSFWPKNLDLKMSFMKPFIVPSFGNGRSRDKLASLVAGC